MLKKNIANLLKNPVVLGTLVSNLILGNVCIFFMAEKDETSTYLLMAFSGSFAAIVFLLVGFSRVTETSCWWLLPFSGAFYTLLVPFTITFFMTVSIAFSETGILELLGKGIIAGILGTLVGSVFAIPFLCGNTLVFFLYWRRLRRE